jgi:PAS domain S-box-containing protein
MIEDTEGEGIGSDLRLGKEIIATMEGALCVVRANDSTIIYANPSFEKMFGYDAGEIMGKHVATLIAARHKTPEDIQHHIGTELRRYGRWRGEMLNRRKDGTSFWTSTMISTFEHSEFGKVWITIHQDISARKQAEHILREQAALLELAHDAIMVCDLEDRITFWNRGAKDSYGWPAEEALGRVAYDLLRTKFSIPFEQIKNALELQEEWEGELEHTTRDGKMIVMGSRWSLLEDDAGRPTAVLKINRDMTDRKRNEQQCRNLSERLALATKTAAIGIWDLDLRTEQLLWDDTTFEIFDIPRVVPMTREEFRRWVHPDDLSAVQAAAQHSIQAKARASVEFRIFRRNGSIRYVSTVMGAVLDEQGDVVRLVGTIVDTTERKEMEIQMEASARLSALGMMAGGVAHEINNPLAVIHGSAVDLLHKLKTGGSVPVDIALRHGERIVETSNRIAKIIKSMRHLSREGSHDKVRATLVSKILGETLEICGERFKHHGVRLLLSNVDPTLSVYCREVQIGQVLLNLLQNAFDSVAEQPKERWVRLAALVRDDAVEFSVTDSGAAIPPQLKTKIMEPFFTTKEAGKGTGLGLSISRSIVKDHGGELDLREEDGHPCFFFCLPRSTNKECYAA